MKQAQAKKGSKHAMKTVAVRPAVSQIPHLKRGHPTGSMHDGLFQICYSEFVCPLDTLPATSGWQLIPPSSQTPGLDVNPGSALMFPWLCEQARHWEQYTFRKLTFELVPKQPTTSRGLVALGFDYDYADRVATSKADMLQNQSIVEGPAFSPLRLDVDCGLLNKTFKRRYVANANGEETGDVRLIWAGFLMVSLDSVTVGEPYGFDLWVSYDVEFSIPRSGSELVDSGIGLPQAYFTSTEFTSLANQVRSGLESIQSARNLFRVVQPLIDGVPDLKDARAVRVDHALDMSALKGVLVKKTKLAPTGGELLTNSPLSELLSVWDAAGTLLTSRRCAEIGTSIPENDIGPLFEAQGGVWSDFKPSPATKQVTAESSAPVSLISYIPIDGIRKVYPTAKFLTSLISGRADAGSLMGTVTTAALTVSLLLLSGDKHSRGL